MSNTKMIKVTHYYSYSTVNDSCMNVIKILRFEMKHVVHLTLR